MNQISSSGKAGSEARCGASGKLSNATDELIWFTEGRICALAGRRYTPLVVIRTSQRPPKDWGRGLCLASKRANPVKRFRMNDKCSKAYVLPHLPFRNVKWVTNRYNSARRSERSLNDGQEDDLTAVMMTMA